MFRTRTSAPLTLSLQIGVLDVSAGTDTGPIPDIHPIVQRIIEQASAITKSASLDPGETVCVFHPRSTADIALVNQARQLGVKTKFVLDRPFERLPPEVSSEIDARQVVVQMAEDVAEPEERSAGARHIVVSQSDLLLVTSRGQFENRQSLLHSIFAGEAPSAPVVLIGPLGGAEPVFIAVDDGGDRATDIYGELATWAQAVFYLPRKPLHRFQIFEPGAAAGGFYSLLLWMLTGKRPKDNPFWIRGFEEKKKTALRIEGVMIAARHSAWLDFIRSDYASNYVWADKLAIFYGDLFRTVILAILTLSSIAGGAITYLLTGVARGSELAHHVEETSLALIVVLTIAGLCFKWKQKWLDYRLLAELVRPMPYLAALGYRFHPAVAKGKSGQYWNRVAWQYRSLVSAAGCHAMVISPEYLSDFKQILLNLVESQITWHTDNEEKQRKAGGKLHRTAALLFGFVLLVSFGHAFLEYQLPHWRVWMLYTAACATIVASAIHALTSYIGFEQVTERSELARNQLIRLKTRIENDREKPGLERVGRWCTEVGRIMAEEQLGWYNQMSVISLHLQ